MICRTVINRWLTIVIASLLRRSSSCCSLTTFRPKVVAGAGILTRRILMNRYCMFKGVVVNAAPFKPEYPGSPHYVVTVKGDDGKPFKIVINSASDTVGEDGNNNVYFYADLNFDDPLNEKLGKLAHGLHTD